jgi:hypothetical protein
MVESQKKILLGMLVSNGDCLMATVIAKQIKSDYPGCHLTWAISNICRSIIEHNPYIDAIWEIILENKKQAEGDRWHEFVKAAAERKEHGEFDEVFLTQIYPSNVCHYDGTTRGTIYNSYPNKITVNATPVLRLTDNEINNVSLFIKKHSFKEHQHILLFECFPASGQSFIDPSWAIEVSYQLIKQKKDLLIVLSSHLLLETAHERIISAHDITLRETAELAKYCNLLVGCSSGITWICSSDWAGNIPTIQFLNCGIGFRFASVAYDHKYWGLPFKHIIESTVKNKEYAAEIILDVLENGIDKSKKKYHEELRPRFISMVKYGFMFFRKGKLLKALKIMKSFIKRNYFGQKYKKRFYKK